MPDPNAKIRRIVYAYVEPRVNHPRFCEPRYIGQDSVDGSRMKNLFGHESQPLVGPWLKLLKTQNIKPGMFILDDFIGTLKELDAHETARVTEFKDYGFILKNANAGGAGNPGYELPEKSRQSISNHAKIRMQDPKVRENLSVKASARMANPEFIENLSKKQKERMAKPGVREHLSEMTKKQFEDPEARRQASIKATAANNKRYEDPKERQKVSDGNKRRFSDPNEGKRISETLFKFYEDNPDAGYKAMKKMCRKIKDQNGRIYDGTRPAARELGLNSSNITNVLKGKYKHTGGYTFTYVDND
jgi:hypothetical protein